jgi:putative transcriptional regulator
MRTDQKEILKGFLTGAVVGGLIFAAAWAARAQGLDKPVLLVASPKTSSFYSGAVLVVVPKEGAHVGFIINRASRTTVASAFADEPDMAKVVDPVYFGGPKGAQSMYAVVRRDPGEGARKLFGDVFVTISGETVDRVIRQWPGEARFFAGYAAWESGELAAQIEDGDWLLAEPDEALLFHQEPGAMWAGLVQRIRQTF